MDKQKFGACITAIIKNEATYIEEWLCYHRALGVDHFFIFDNNSEDNIDQVLKPYLTHGIATLIRWPLLGGQIDAYNYALHFFGQATEWMAYIDLDEFIVLKDSDSLPAFLSGLEGADQVLMPWRSIGFSGHRKRPAGLVIENYIQAQDIPPDGFARLHVKGIVRCAAAKRVTAHYTITHSQATVDGLNRRVPEDFALQKPTYERIQLNHYYTKSYEEFEAKLARGQGDNGAEKGKVDFNRPGFNTEDRSAQRNLEATRRQLALMASLSPSPFRYGSQLASGAPQPRDPFSWACQVAISNFLADSPTLQLGAPVPFENIAKRGDTMVARASDFKRTPQLGAFRRSIHIADVLRRLGNDIVFDLVADNQNRVKAIDGQTPEHGGESVLLRPADRCALKVRTERPTLSRCYGVGYALRTATPLNMQFALTCANEEHALQPVAKAVDMPAAGYYCGILELNRAPVRATDLQIAFGKMASDVEIFDLFAIAYG
jgi:hypothetical protein